MSIVPRSGSDLWDSSFPRDLWESSFPRELWEPFERFPFIRDFFLAPFWGFGAPSLSSSFVETPDAHVMKTYMPGLKKEDVKVEVEDGVVTVTLPKKEVKRPERRTIEIAGV